MENLSDSGYQDLITSKSLCELLYQEFFELQLEKCGQNCLSVRLEDSSRPSTLILEITAGWASLVNDHWY
jgi:hypothetical protein